MRFLRFFFTAVLVVAPAVGVIIGLVYATRPTTPASPELDTPVLAMESVAANVRAKPLFFNMPAVPYVKEHWQEWCKPFGLPTPLPEELAVTFEGTLQTPQSWRALDRKWRFAAILLSGDPANFRPLLDHLRGSTDWTLTHVTPSSIVFERSPAKAWTAADIAPLLAVFKTHSVQEQRAARYLLAHRLMFLGESALAKKLLDEVLSANPKCKEASTELAYLFGMQGQWADAVKAVNSALMADRHYRPAQTAQVNAFYALGRFDEALEVSRSLYDAAPTDGPTLLLHAKVTHAAHAYQEEIDVLRKVINMAKIASQPLGTWQIYLGQAYASTGEAALARDQFYEALKDKTLSESERDFIKAALERVAPRGDLLDNVPSLQSSLLDAPP